MKKLFKKLEEYWEWFTNLTKTNGFIWTFPAIALTLAILFPVRIVIFLLLAIWVVALIVNTDEEI